jgi:hypothetical protein
MTNSCLKQTDRRPTGKRGSREIVVPRPDGTSAGK